VVGNVEVRVIAERVQYLGPDGKLITESLKTEWVPETGYRSLPEAKMDIGQYLMGYYNQQRPHRANGGISPQAAEEKLKTMSGIS
jgi:putative transposase